MQARKKVILGLVIIIILIWSTGFILVNISRTKVKGHIEQNLNCYISHVSNFIKNEIDFEISSFIIESRKAGVQQFVQDANRKLSRFSDPKEYIKRTHSWWENLPDDKTDEFIDGIVNDNMSEKFLFRGLRFGDLGVNVYLGSVLTDSLGGLILAYPKPVRYDYSHEYWWDKMRSEGLYVKDCYFDETSKKYVMRICVSIEDSKGNFIGAQRISINIEYLLKLLFNSFNRDKWYSRYNENYILIDTTGKILFSKYGYDFLSKYDHLEAIKSKLENGEKSVELKDIHGQEKLLFFNPINSRGDKHYSWIVVAEQDKDVVYSEMNFLTHDIFLFCFFITILLVIAVLFLIKLQNPFWLLNDEIQRIRKSDLANKIGLDINDESGNIGKMFNELCEKIENYQEQISAQQKEITQSYDNFKEENKEKIKNSELFLKEKDKLTATLKSIRDAVIIVDTDGIITMMNSCAENLLKVTFKDDEKMHIDSVFFIQEHNLRSFKEIFKFLTSPEHNNYFSEEVNLINSEGMNSLIHNSVSAIVDSQNLIIGVIFLFRDIAKNKDLLK